MKKTITSLIRDNQHKLNEQPSPQAWRRLERRLNDHRRYGKTSILRQIASIAALLALGTLVTLLGLLFEPRKSNALAANNYTPEKLEDMKTNDGDGNTIMEFIQKYSDRLAQPIAEGDISRRITLAGNIKKALNSQIKVSMNDFKWLEGSWKHEINDQPATETWSKVNATTLEGQTFFVDAKGEYTFSDQMRIYLAKGKIFFETTLEKDKAPVRYTLKHFFANRIVFENEDIAFPQQAIFEIQSPNVFSITLQNDELLNMNTSQASYVQRHYTLQPQRAVRVFERAE